MTKRYSKILIYFFILTVPINAFSQRDTCHIINSFFEKAFVHSQDETVEQGERWIDHKLSHLLKNGIANYETFEIVIYHDKLNTVLQNVLKKVQQVAKKAQGVRSAESIDMPALIGIAYQYVTRNEEFNSIVKLISIIEYGTKEESILAAESLFAVFPVGGKYLPSSQLLHYLSNIPVNLNVWRIDGIKLVDVLEDYSRAGKEYFYRYIVSNEKYHELFVSLIRNKKGGYIGLGAEQNYSLMAMAKSTFAWLYDRNPMLIMIHYLNKIAFFNSKNAYEFVSFYSESNRDRASRFIYQNLGINFGYVYSYFSPLIHKHYQSLMAPFKHHSYYYTKYGEVGMEHRRTFLNNHEDFMHIKKMFIGNRVELIKFDHNEGDLLFKTIDGMAEMKGIPINVLYLSNSVTEYYGVFDSGSVFHNILGLKNTKDGVLLTTENHAFEYFNVPKYDRNHSPSGYIHLNPGDDFDTWDYYSIRLEDFQDYIGEAL